jgi:hypothetical protein
VWRFELFWCFFFWASYFAAVVVGLEGLAKRTGDRSGGVGSGERRIEYVGGMGLGMEHGVGSWGCS